MSENHGVSTTGRVLAEIAKKGEYLGAPYTRPPCPFYGFIGIVGAEVLLDNNGNACGLTMSHSPCKMEVDNQKPDWENCNHFNREGEVETIAKVLNKFTIFPDELRPLHLVEWSGVSVRGWFHLIVKK